MTTSAVIVAASCRDCRHEICSAPEYAPGRDMAIIHAGHARELEALGWIRTTHGRGEPDDLVCPHNPALCDPDS